MDIFESLENLNVSEECFEDIVGLVEMYLNEEDSLDDGSHIRKRYGNPEYKKDENGRKVYTDKGFEIPANKSAKLYAKAHSKDNRYPYAPAFNDGKGVGEYGKRVPKGDSDRGTWVTTDNPKEIQEPLSIAKSQEKGARKLLDKDEFKNVRDRVKAKRLLQGALKDKSLQLRKKAAHLDKEADEPFNNDEDGTALEISRQAQQRKEAANKASAEAHKVLHDRSKDVPKKLESKDHGWFKKLEVEDEEL